jgi:hypothetical protein
MINHADSLMTKSEALKLESRIKQMPPDGKTAVLEDAFNAARIT